MKNKTETQNKKMQEEIFSKILKAGSRTYFFDVRETRAGDYYLTITESKRSGSIEDSAFKKFKIYLYKEDFSKFKEILDEATKFIIDEKGDEVISERHQKDFISNREIHSQEDKSTTNISDFDDIKFE